MDSKIAQMDFLCAIIPPTGHRRERRRPAAEDAGHPVPRSARSAACIKEGSMMSKPVKVTCFKQVHNIVTAAAQCRREVSVQDLKGAVADAKSILGLMNLDFSQPVEICGEDPAEVEHVYNAVRH